MKGYKAFEKDLTCRGFQYEVGKEYEMDESPEPCQRGFHFCKTIANCYNYYPMEEDTRICEVEALGEVATDDNEKFCTNKIRVVAEVTEEYIRKANNDKSSSGYCNSGNKNSGYWNSGDCNSGDYNSSYCNSGNYNSGNYNSGDCNSGDYNSSDCNSGNYNSGNYNSGNKNSGGCNSGNWNSGNKNSGDWNSGNWNSSNRNSGNRNSGDCNSGNYNSGNYNSGNCNSGDCNSGDYNSGNKNSGYWNSGYWNSGDYNSGNWNSGVFNTSGNPTIKMFDQESDWTMDDWLNSQARYIMSRCPYTYSDFVCKSDMTPEEIEKHPECVTIGGYVKVFKVTDEDKQKWWDELDEKDKAEVMSLPNFDKDKFKQCTGVEIN